MSQRTFIGVDPGKQGAIAQIGEDGKVVGFWKMPVAKVGKGVIDRAALADIFREIAFGRSSGDGPVALAAIEEVTSMPGNAAQSMLQYGKGAGAILGMWALLDIPHVEIKPAIWKKQLLPGAPEGKDASFVLARQLFPQRDVQDALKKKCNDGIAEAILIAEWARRLHTPQGGSTH